MRRASKVTNSKKSSKSSRGNESASIKGLYIKREDTLNTQSQATVYSQRTNRTAGSIETLGTQDFYLNEEEFDREEMHEVFYSEQEERVIQKILEIARKGKINSKNAFEIPIKLADNQHSNTSQSKFWKIASELLGASINIFDKRIENTWISTNKIHEKLSRLNMEERNLRKDDDDDQNDNNNQDQKKNSNNKDFFISLDQFRDPNILQRPVIGENTLQEVDRLENKKLKMSQSMDPLFNQKLKTFDNNSLKGLLLNVFSVRQDCQINLFANRHKKNERNLDSMNEMFEQMQPFLKKNKEYRSIGIFEQIAGYNKNHVLSKENQREDKDNFGLTRNETLFADQTFNQFEKFIDQQPEEYLQSQMPILQDQQIFSHQAEQQNVQSQPNKITFNFAQDTEEQNCQSEQYLLSSNSLMNKSFHSVMTPWQLEFKEGKIQKKKGVRRKKTDNSSRVRQKIQPGEVSFDFLIIEKSKDVFKVDNKKNSRKQMKGKSKRERNLLSQQLVVYEKMNFKKLNFVRGNQSVSGSIKQHYNDAQIPDFLAPDPSSMFAQHQNKEEDRENEPQNFNLDEYHSTNQNMLPWSAPNSSNESQNILLHRNIRQMKKALFEEVRENRQLWISDLSDKISPQNALVTFLHLANQKNLVVREQTYEDDQDIVLCWQ